MASTYTAAGIELITQGEQAGAWGDTTNTNWELIEEMVGGVVSVALSSTSETLTTSDGASSDGRHAVINFTGSPGGTCTVTISPNDMQKVYFVLNNSDETVTISQGSGANVNIAAGKAKIVYCDGAGAGAAVVDISSGFDATTLAELGVTASAAEINILDGATLDVDELNLLDGVTATTTELNYVDGVTSSIQTQLDAKVAKSGSTMTGFLTLSADPTSANHAATKQYVDTQTSAGIHYHDPVRGEVGSNQSVTYDNGSSGVGATLTATSNGAFAAGGISDWSTTERVLMYGQTDATQNGIYTVTTVGDGSNPYVLTRATDTDSYGASDPDALGTGDAFYVQEGDGAGELYVMTTEGTITFGTTDITFSQISSAAIYSAGTDLTLTGTEFSLNSSIAADTSGNAATATALATARSIGISLSGDVTGSGSASFDGTGNITITASNMAVQANSVALGTDTTGNYVQQGATSGNGISGSVNSEGGTFTVTSNATNANTPSTIVYRDASGNFSAGTITAALSGNATTSSSCSGNAATATTLATARTIGGVSFDGSANINLPGVNTAGNQNTSGNAATATALATSRTLQISGDATGSASFDGSANANISISLAADSVSASEIAANAVGASELNVTGNGTTSQFLRSDGDGTFTWATPTDTNTTYTASTGLTLTGTAFSVNYGSTSTTACVGNDSRLSNSRTCNNSFDNAATSRTNLGLGSLATLSTVDASTITDNSVGAAELNVSGNGTTAQFLRSDGDGTFTWATPTDTNTTYSAGAGLDLSSTTFSVESDLRGDVFYIGRDTNDYIGVETTQINFVLDGNTDARLYNNGDFHADGNIIAYSTSISDERLKEDIVGIDDALNKVCSLSGYTFKYKADGKVSAGVIAQEVEKVLPEAVTETQLLKVDDGNEYKVVNYDALHGLLIEAVKELSAKVKELEAKVG